MSDIDDGGPAFPSGKRSVYGEFVSNASGMALRDYFAAQAMQALLSSDEWRVDCDHKMTASSAYRAADAMLAMREATKE